MYVFPSVYTHNEHIRIIIREPPPSAQQQHESSKHSTMRSATSSLHRDGIAKEGAPVQLHLLDSMRDRVQQLEADVVQYKAEIERVSKAHASILSEHEEYQRQANNVVSQWVEENNMLVNKLTMVEKDRAEITAKNGKLSESVAALQEANAKHKETLLSEQSRAARLTDRIAHLEADAHTQHQTFNSALIKAEDDLAALEASNEKLATENSSIVSMNKRLEAERDRMKEDLTDALSMIKAFRDELRHEKNRNAKFEEDTKAASRGQESVREQLGELQRLTEERGVLLMDAEGRLEALYQECDKLREECKRSDVAAEVLVHRLRGVEQTLHDTEAKKSAALQQLDVFTQQNQSLRTQLDNAESDVAEMEDSMTSMRRVVEELQSQLSGYASQAESSDKALNDAIVQKASLMSDNDELKASLKAIEHQAREQASIIDALTEELQNATSDTTVRLNTLETAAAKATAELQLHREKYNAASSALSESQRTVSQQAAELEEVSAKLAVSEHAVGTLQDNIQTLRDETKHLADMLKDAEQDREAAKVRHEAEKTALERSLEETRELGAQVHIRATELDQKLQSALADSELYRQQLSEMGEEYTTLSAYVLRQSEDLDGELRQVREEKDKLHDAFIAVKKENEVLHRDARQRQEMTSAEKQAMRQHEQDLAALKKDLRQAERQLEEQRSNAMLQVQGLRSSYEKDMTQLRQTVQELKATNDDVSSQLAEEQESSRAKLKDEEGKFLKLQKAAQTRIERYEEELEKCWAERKSEREMFTLKYNQAVTAYEEEKKKRKQDVDGTVSALPSQQQQQQQGDSNATSKIVTEQLEKANQTLQSQLSRCTEHLKRLTHTCELQENELQVLRRDVSLLRKTLSGQLVDADLVDANEILNDRCVTVQSLNVAEGPRRQPQRRRPTTLLPPSDSTFGAAIEPRSSSSSMSAEPGRTSIVLDMDNNSSRFSSESTHHMKIARRNAATPFEQHNANTAHLSSRR